MHRYLLAILTTALLSQPLLAGNRPAPVEVMLETTLGPIVMSIDVASAPLAGNYLLGYIDAGRYDGATLYRSAALDGAAAPQLIQGGMLAGALTQSGAVDPADYGVTELLPVWETTSESGRQHRRGTVSLARDLLATGSVIPELVICLRDTPAMDEHGRQIPDSRGYPAIGSVVSGMAVVEQVTQQPLDGATAIPFLAGQILSAPITITRAYRLRTDPYP